jgi:hypothetical protein
LTSLIKRRLQRRHGAIHFAFLLKLKGLLEDRLELRR